MLKSGILELALNAAVSTPLRGGETANPVLLATFLALFAPAFKKWCFGLPVYYFVAASAGTAISFLYLHSEFGHCSTGPAFSHFSTM